MKQFLIISMLCCLYGCNTNATDQPSTSAISDSLYISPEDSIATTKLAYNFYTWYGDALLKDTLRAFDPVFIKDADGYTTLDFSTFEKHMLRLNFTNDHIQRIKNGFNNCSENLKGVPYDSIFILQDEERMNTMGCFFTQGSPIWEKPYAGISGAEVLRIVRMNLNTIHVIIHTYSDRGYVNPGSNERIFEEDEIAVQTVKEGDKWKIQEIRNLPSKVIEE